MPEGQGFCRPARRKIRNTGMYFKVFRRARIAKGPAFSACGYRFLKAGKPQKGGGTPPDRLIRLSKSPLQKFAAPRRQRVSAASPAAGMREKPAAPRLPAKGGQPGRRAGQILFKTDVSHFFDAKSRRRGGYPVRRLFMQRFKSPVAPRQSGNKSAGK